VWIGTRITFCHIIHEVYEKVKTERIMIRHILWTSSLAAEHE